MLSITFSHYLINYSLFISLFNLVIIQPENTYSLKSVDMYVMGCDVNAQMKYVYDYKLPFRLT